MRNKLTAVLLLSVMGLLFPAQDCDMAKSPIKTQK